MAVNVPLQTLFANTRAGTVYQTTSAGGILAVSANTTRTAHWRSGKPHALFEPSRTNSIRNNTFTGGTAGVLGSGGVRPTYVSFDGIAAGATTVGFGTEDGLPYMDVRFNGTPTSSVVINFEEVGAISASDGQNWTVSSYIKLQSGTTSNVDSIKLSNRRGASGGAFHSVRQSAALSVSPTRQRFSFLDLAISDAHGSGTIDNTRPQIVLAWTSGAIDITLRCYAPQMELGAFATSPILTSGSAVTRAADNATCSVSTFPIDQNGGSIEIIGRADYTVGGSGTPRVFQIDDGTNSNRVSLYIEESSGNLRLLVNTSGVDVANESLAYTSGSEFHAMLVFKEDNIFISLGGSDSTPDTSAAFPVGLFTNWRWANNATGNGGGASVFINRIASHSHEFSTTAANTITG